MTFESRPHAREPRQANPVEEEALDDYFQLDYEDITESNEINIPR